MDNTIAAGRICALILCGGKSSRMGADKALMDWNGQTLLERAADFWRSREGIDSVLAAAGREEHIPDLPGDVIPVYDLYPGQGPMAGLHAAFSRTDAELLYVSAVDMPFLRPDAILPAPAGDAAVYVKDGRPEPLFGVYRRTCLPLMERLLGEGRNRMSALLEEADTEYVPLPASFDGLLNNLNTPADRMRALAGTPPTLLCMGWSGSGKTTFLEKLLPALTARGLTAAVIKHDAHGFQMDTPGKDTWRLARAGAVGVAISGPGGWAVLGPQDIELEDLRAKLPPADLILVEGHKHGAYPKLQIRRRAAGKPFIPCGNTLLALVTDDPLPDLDVPQLGLEDAAACADLILRTFFPERQPGGEHCRPAGQAGRQPGRSGL